MQPTTALQNRLQNFNYADFKRRFHEAACRQGIDPIEGATSYQAALVQARLRVAAFRASGVYGWSAGRDIFSERNDGVELFRKANVVPVPFDDVLDEWGVEVLREVIRELKADTPLKQIYAHQVRTAVPFAKAKPEASHAAWEAALLAKVSERVTAAP